MEEISSSVRNPRSFIRNLLSSASARQTYHSVIVQKRRTVNQRPDDILGDGQAFVLELLLAERNGAAQLLELRVHRQRLLGSGQLGFELLHARVVWQRPLLNGQLGLQLLVLPVVLADLRQERIPLGVGALVRRLGQNRRDFCRQAQVQRRRGIGHRQPEAAERVLAVGIVLDDREFQHAIFCILDWLGQLEHGRVVLAELRGDRPAVVRFDIGLAIDRTSHAVIGLAEIGLGVVQLHVGVAVTLCRKQADRVDRQDRLLVVDQDAESGQFRVDLDGDRRTQAATVAWGQRAA